jgi:Ca-activated chloride channel homolog
MRFANNVALWLLLVNLPLLYWGYRRQLDRVTFSTISYTQHFQQISWRAWAGRYLWLLRIVAFSCIVVALARPQVLTGVQESKSEVVDIMVALDTSQSMGARDFQPQNRLAVAKELVAEFIDLRQADRVGLITFAAYGQLRCPLTVDYATLKEILQEVTLVDRNDLDANGTAIGLAIGSSVNHLRRSRAKSRVVVLLTDGENNISTLDPQTAAEIARTLGIKMYTVGIGKIGMVPMPSLNPNDPPDTFTLQPSKFDEAGLQRLAAMTGGKYYHAVDRQSFRQIFQEIDQLEKTLVAVRRYERYEEKFLPWIVAALAALVIEAILQHSYLRILP